MRLFITWCLSSHYSASIRRESCADLHMEDKHASVGNLPSIDQYRAGS
jgi:hypothetical protein